ncbi:hypothetical protein EDD85DRAFT_798607 [Armillaria nabsnona]|nr:hypothetical protein EDD85DRAFT_798607 [Armillaria nabsnona]
MIPDLQVLTLDNQEGRIRGWKPKTSADIVTCPSLRRVHVYDLALFRPFNLPSLDELVIEDLASNFGAGNNKEEDIFYDFFERSGFPITKLKLVVRTYVNDFARMFDMAFRLVDLDITLPTPAIAALLFQALLLTGDKTDVLPELRSLKADCRTISHLRELEARLTNVPDLLNLISTGDGKYISENAGASGIKLRQVGVQETVRCCTPRQPIGGPGIDQRHVQEQSFLSEIMRIPPNLVAQLKQELDLDGKEPTAMTFDEKRTQRNLPSSSNTAMASDERHRKRARGNPLSNPPPPDISEPPFTFEFIRTVVNMMEIFDPSTHPPPSDCCHICGASRHDDSVDIQFDRDSGQWFFHPDDADLWI